MNEVEKVRRYEMDADDKAVVMMALAEALGLPYEVRLIGDRTNWVSVEVVGWPQP